MIENVLTKCIIFGEALRIRVKKFKQILPENYTKSTKIAIIAYKFSKSFREHAAETRWSRGGQTTARGPHAAREIISCGPRALTRI